MIELILLLETIYFFLPAGIANMIPVLVRKVPFLESPVWRGIFGKNKTWRGIFFAVICGMVVAGLQTIIGWDLSFFNYGEYNFLLFGFLSGFGAIIGDLVESGIKRGFNINPGKSWIPFDQIDYIFGGLIFISFYISLSWMVMFIILIEYFFIHFLINYIGFTWGLRKNAI